MARIIFACALLISKRGRGGCGAGRAAMKLAKSFSAAPKSAAATRSEVAASATPGAVKANCGGVVLHGLRRQA